MTGGAEYFRRQVPHYDTTNAAAVFQSALQCGALHFRQCEQFARLPDQRSFRWGHLLYPSVDRGRCVEFQFTFVGCDDFCKAASFPCAGFHRSNGRHKGQHVGQSAECPVRQFQKSRRPRDVYVTNDANNLYIGFQFNGDPWGSSVNNDLLAHYVFLIDTGTTGGTSQDPWKYTTSVSWNKSRILRWRARTQKFQREFVQCNDAVRFRRLWKSTTTMVSGSDYSSSITNDWAEFKVPLSVMSSTTGVQLRIAVLFQPDDNKPGISDSVPYDSAGCSDWGNGNPAVVSQYFTYTLQGVGDMTPPSAVTGLSAAQGRWRER